jgi:arginyl-tRNA synthetase
VDIRTDIQSAVTAAIEGLFAKRIEPDLLVINPTKPEFTGEYTVVTFGLARALGKSPGDIAEAIGAALLERGELISAYEVVKGFLNLSLNTACWDRALSFLEENPEGWKGSPKGEKVLIEFSSPNTNKPLHLGHIRNNLLGWSVSQILAASGYEVIRTQIFNDRGIAICKSMLARQKFGPEETPGSMGMKPDHFVGHWYVLFEQAFREEYRAWQETEAAAGAMRIAGTEDADAFFKEYRNTYFNEASALGREAREMLHRWESGDPGTIALWKQMNAWVYEGFDQTYARLGVAFDKKDYESQTWEQGKDMVIAGLERGVFYRHEDGSVWVDLSDEGLDQKILLRSDGTSVYITQDLGTAHMRYAELGTRRMVYVVADEQDYHFKALFSTLKKLDEPYADGLHHLSYGMVDLPSGKMKSREGIVVDADDLLDTVYAEAEKAAADRGEIAGMTPEEQEDILNRISLAALKFFILRVDPKKRMLFNPAESVDLQGQTGPYIQNAYVRIRSILARVEDRKDNAGRYEPNADERRLLSENIQFHEVVRDAAEQYSPSLVAQYCYNLAKTFHRYYHEYRVLNAETPGAREYRLRLITCVARTLQDGMELLGIGMPEKM